VCGRYYIGEVPRLYLCVISLYSPDHEVDRGSDSPVEPFIVLLLSMRTVEHHYYREVIALFMIFLGDITMHKYNLFL